MDNSSKKQIASLGLRVGTIFLISVVIVLVVAYLVISQNLQKLLTDYTITLVESMTEQGAKLVTTELEMEKLEISSLAHAFIPPEDADESVVFPSLYTEEGTIRMLYVTKGGTVSSDGRTKDVQHRQDIVDAFSGESAIYGPYFNEENEFVICYSAPVKQDGNIVGVLSVENDGYRFCEIIESIRFVHSGESYIINAEGTDIAVSDENHIDWVNTQYNARKIYETQPTEETKSIIDLEQKGLDGESGVGTYYWNGGLCYVFYKPIPSVNWVLLAGLRDEEIVSMAKSTLISSVSNGPILGMCLFLVLFIIALNVYWIISSMKKNAQINEKLKIIASYDSLTGLLNRNSYNTALDLLSKDVERFFTCVYIDVNGLHELNNVSGHQAGDDMLKAVADALKNSFPHDQVYRIGGDEFVVLYLDKPTNNIEQITEKVRQALRSQNCEISIGVARRKRDDADTVVSEAEQAMRRDKQRFYENENSNRQMRNIHQTNFIS